MAASMTQCPKSEIAVVLYWELVAVDTHVDAPDEVSGISYHQSEYCVESDTWRLMSTG
jgi:hypothetical protein